MVIHEAVMAGNTLFSIPIGLRHPSITCTHLCSASMLETATAFSLNHPNKPNSEHECTPRLAREDTGFPMSSFRISNLTPLASLIHLCSFKGGPRTQAGKIPLHV